MDKITYSDAVLVISELETIEEAVAPPKYRKCCRNFLELCKMVELCLKNEKSK